LQRTLWPELSRAWGLGDVHAVRKMLQAGLAVTLVGVMAGATGLLVFGNAIIEAWTHAKINPSWNSLFLLVVAAAINAVWQVPLIVITANNAHGSVSKYYLTLCFLPVLALVSLGATESVAGVSLIVTELLIAIVVSNECRRVIREGRIAK